jgi:hypothetical protein
MEIRLVINPIAMTEVAALAKDQFGEMIKAVVDIERELMALGGELHSDEEALLLEDGSAQEHLWGINIYPEKSEGDMIEFDSMINIRPSQNNRSRGVESPVIRERVLRVVGKMIQP